MENKFEDLENLLGLNILKMNILECELEATQNLLVGLFVEEGEGKKKTFKNIKENFNRLRDRFNKQIEELGLKDKV